MDKNDIFLSIQRVKAIFQAIEEAPDQDTLEAMHPEIRLEAIIRGYLKETPECIEMFVSEYTKLKREEMPDLKNIQSLHDIEVAMFEGLEERYGSRYWLHRPSLQLRPRGRRFPSYYRKK